MRGPYEKVLVTAAAVGVAFSATSCGSVEEGLPAPMVDTEASCRDESQHEGSNITIAPGEEDNTALREEVQSVDRQLQTSWCQRAVAIGNSMLEAYNSQDENGGIAKLARGPRVTLSAEHTSDGQTDRVDATYSIENGKTYFCSLEVTDAQKGYTDTADFSRLNSGGHEDPEANGVVWTMEVVREEGAEVDPYYTFPPVLYAIEDAEELKTHAKQSTATMQEVQGVVDDVMAHN